MCVISIIMPCVHGFLYLTSGLYADAAMNGYYIIAGIYGWIVWYTSSGNQHKKAGRVTNTPLSIVPTLLVAFVVVYGVIFVFLTHFTNSSVPYLDTLSTALSIIALWMLSRKYTEQWLVWLVVDIISCGLYIYKGIPFTAGLYGVYSILAVVGYIRWRRLCLQQL